MTSMIDRRRFLGTAAGGLLAAPLAAGAQQAGRVYRVGILTNKAADQAEARLWQAFRSGLRESGWIVEHEQVVVLNTGAGLKHPSTVDVEVPVLPRDGAVPPA